MGERAHSKRAAIVSLENYTICIYGVYSDCTKQFPYRHRPKSTNRENEKDHLQFMGRSPMLSPRYTPLQQVLFKVWSVNTFFYVLYFLGQMQIDLEGE